MNFLPLAVFEIESSRFEWIEIGIATELKVELMNRLLLLLYYYY